MKKISTNNEGKNIFDSIRRVSEDGSEFWSARDFMPLLGYGTWQKFEEAINRARTACKESGNDAAVHFLPAPVKSTGGRPGKDHHLSRYACYLVAQNGDPRKSEIAEAQTYFAIKTREREQDEAKNYLFARKEKRDKLKESNKALSSAAKEKGVKTPKDFASFNDAGTEGLYGGMTTAQVKKKKGIPSKANLQDRMSLDELTANDFAKMLSRRKLQNSSQTGVSHATEINRSAHERVREDLAKFGNTLPEDLPAEADIDIAEKRLIDPSRAYCKIFSHKSEKVLEIHLPDEFTDEQVESLRLLLKDNQGSGYVCIYLRGEKIRDVSFGVRCTRQLSKEIEEIFSSPKNKLK